MKTNHIFFLAVLLLGVHISANAGQMASHEFSAIRSTKFLAGRARNIVENSRTAYLTGAQGPDTIGVVMTALDYLSAFNSVGKETHYSDQKAALAVNILDRAKTDDEIAFAIGWISHYINDIHVHAVVNQYGGFYEKAGKLHKQLEQLETKHVYFKHDDIVTEPITLATPRPFKGDFGGFIFDAYHDTFPDNEIYQSGNEWLVSNRPYFIKRLMEATGWSMDASNMFYRSHTKGDGIHDESWAATARLFPAMPTTEFYKFLEKNVTITDIKTSANRVTFTAKVNDNKLYSRFLVDWEKEVDAAVAETEKVYGLISEYLEAKDPVAKADIRTRLVGAVPNVNLDQPKSDFDFDKTIPGNVSISELSYVLGVSPTNDKGTYYEIEGKSSPMKLGDKELWAGSKSGEVTFDIDLPKPMEEYKFKLNLDLSGKDAFKEPTYRDVDWVQADGKYPGTWLSSPGMVTVADFFTVRMPLPKELIGKEGDRRYVIMDGYKELEESDLPLIRARLTNDKFRYDVVPIEEKIDGTELEAKLQITNTYVANNTLKGRQKLVMIWFDKGKGESDTGKVLGELSDDLKDATATMDKAQKEIDSQMTPEQQAEAQAEVEAYSAELDAKGLTEEQKAPKLATRAAEIMKRMGVKIEQSEDLKSDIAKLKDSSKMPFFVVSELDLACINIACAVSGGWTEAEYSKTDKPTNNRLYQITKEQKDEKGRVMWSIEGSFSALLADDPEMVKYSQEKAKGADELSVSGFTGPFAQAQESKTTETPALYSVTGNGVLTKGKVFLDVHYGITVKAYKIYEYNEETKKSELVYDGTEDAQGAIEEAMSNCQSYINSVRLIPVR